MNEPRYLYDELSDTLNLCFRPGSATGGYKLCDCIYVKWDKHRNEMMGLFIGNYNILSRETETGPQSIALTGLATMGDELRQSVLAALHHPAVERVLTLSTYRRRNGKVIPIATIHPAPVAVA